MIGALLVIVAALGLTLVLARLGRERVATTDGAGVRFGGFNALRALAAVGVVAGHTMTTSSSLTSWPRFIVSNIATGVALFFVISGFLLYRPFAASLGDRGRVSIGHFVVNRALRILPLYVAVVLVVFVATSAAPRHLVSALTFTGVYVGYDLVPVAWSLDDEVAFYLLLPALYLVLMAWPRAHQRLWLGAAAIIALSLVSLVVLAAHPEDQAIQGGPVTKFHLFGLGMLLATLHARWPKFQLSSRSQAAVAVGALVALSISGVAYERHLYLFNPTCGLAFFMFVGAVAFNGPASLVTRVLSIKPLTHVGDVSYGIYLWHEPLHHVLYNSGLQSTNYALGFLELALCSVALATGTYYLIERPALRIKSRWALTNKGREKPKPSQLRVAQTLPTKPNP